MKLGTWVRIDESTLKRTIRPAIGDSDWIEYEFCHFCPLILVNPVIKPKYKERLNDRYAFNLCKICPMTIKYRIQDWLYWRAKMRGNR